MRNDENKRLDAAVIALAKTLWHYHHLDMPLAKADCIVGLGSYDLRVAKRCADLYAGKWAPLIIFSGHLGNWTKEIWQRSEAHIFAERAIAEGVPADKIYLEDKSTNIGENIRFTEKLLATHGIHAQSAIIVTKPSTERRAFATTQKIWPQMKVLITSPRIDFQEQLQNGIGESLIHELVGDIQRMKIYADRGFQISQHVPDFVWSAYERLVSLGYNKHLVPSCISQVEWRSGDI